ncbi:MAG: histidine phosphatase family protein [Negativicutes bacterium]
MMKLLLIRHGQTDWNLLGKYQGQTDIALSGEGIRQADLLAQNFPVDTLDIIYTSDLQRAFMTAERLAEKFSAPLYADEALRELNFGAWEGLTYQEIAERWPQEVKNLFGAPEKLQIPEGETFLMLQRRAMDKIHEIRAENEGKNVAVVAHGAISKAILTALLHIPLHYVWMLRQDNTAVNILRFDDEFVSVELLNGISHLDQPSLGL